MKNNITLELDWPCQISSQNSWLHTGFLAGQVFSPQVVLITVFVWTCYSWEKIQDILGHTIEKILLVSAFCWTNYVCDTVLNDHKHIFVISLLKFHVTYQLMYTLIPYSHNKLQLADIGDADISVRL